MALNPVGVLVTVSIYTVVFGLVEGALSEEDVDTMDLDVAPEIEAPEGGLFDSIGAVFDTIGGVIAMVLRAIVFQVPGAPWYFRVPISVTIIGSLTWSLATLIRGN